MHRLRTWLASLGYVYFNTRSNAYYARDGLYTGHSDHFRQDPAFQAAYARGVRANGDVDPRMEWRVHVALWAARTASRIAGDFVECGVNSGFVSSSILQYVDWPSLSKRFFLIDTFSGPVLEQYSLEEMKQGRKRIAEDAIRTGGYVTDLQRVRANYAEWPNVEIVQGVVPDILPRAGIDTVALLHLDMNCAYPERVALEYFWSKMTSGGIILFDDYAYFGNEELRRDVDDAARALGTEVLSLPTGQGLIVK